MNDEHVFVGNTSRLIREKSDASRIDQPMVKVMSEIVDAMEKATS